MNFIIYRRIFLLVFAIIFVLLAQASYFFVFNAPEAVAANGYGNYGLDKTIDQGNLRDTLKSGDLPTLIGKIVGAVLAFIGILFFVLLIYGGVLWMTAAGNEEQVKKAIGLITQACFGLAIVSAAYLLTKFVGETVINSFSG